MAALGGSSMLDELECTAIENVGIAIYVDRELEFEGHFQPLLESGECVCD